MSNIGSQENSARFDAIFKQFEKNKLSFMDLRMNEARGLHTKTLRPPRIGTQAKLDRMQKKAAAREFVEKAIEKQLSDAGCVQKGIGKEILLKAGIKEGSAIRVGDLKKIHTVLLTREEDLAKMKTREIESQAKVDVMNLQRRNAAPDFVNSELDGLLDNDITWKVSEAGASGVIFCKDSAGETIPTVLKFETMAENSKVEKAQALMEEMRKFDGMPFSVPNRIFVQLPEGSEERSQIEAKLAELAANAQGNWTLLNKIGSKNSPKGYHAMLNDSHGVVKYELVKEASQISKLDLNTKKELALSENFNRSLAKTMVVGAFCGMHDHLAFGTYDSISSYTNFSNLMIDRDGVINLIDLDVIERENNGQKSIGFPPDLLKQNFERSLDSILELTKEPLDIDTKLGEWHKRIKDGEKLDENPLCQLANDVFFQPSFDGFFDEEDNLKFSEEQVKHAVVFQALGVLDGLEFLAKHRDELSRAASANGYEDCSETLDDLAEWLNSDAVAEARQRLADYHWMKLSQFH